MDVGREGNLRLPGLEGVVIAQDGKDLNLVLGQFMQQPYVVELCRKVVIGAGIDVACDEDGVNLFIDGQLYDFLKARTGALPMMRCQRSSMAARLWNGLPK